MWENYFEYARKNGAVMLDCANFCPNQFPLMTHQRQILERITAGDFELGYDTPGGTKSLRSLIAEYENEYDNLEITHDNVVVNPGGVTGSLDNFFRYLKRNSKQTGKTEVLVPVPAYSEILRSAWYNDLRPIPVPTVSENNFLPRAQDIREKLSDHTGCIFLTSPGNPCCCYIDPEEMTHIITLGKEAKAVVVLDAIFEEANREPKKQPFFSLSDYVKLVKIKGFSKDRPHMNDFRVGWAISRCPYILDGLYSFTKMADFCVPKSITEIARSEICLRLAKVKETKSALNGKSMKRHPEVNQPEIQTYKSEVNTFFETIEKGMSQAVDLCKDNIAVSEVCVPEAGNILFIRLDKQLADRKNIRNDRELHQYVLEQLNISVTPGHIFKADETELWFRVTMTRDPDDFTDEVKRILDAFY